jgi:release factor glutamine methyltransferase
MSNQNSPSPLDPPWTILKILQWATPYFQSRDIDSPRLTAEILLAHVLGVERIDLYARFDQPLSNEELSHLKSLIRRRINREPAAYIIGRKEFMGIDLAVSPDVLIPRPETEFLVGAALDVLPDAVETPPRRVIDMGTGSGAVVIALARHRPGHRYFAFDISAAAIETARANAAAVNADNIVFSAGDLFAPLGEDPEKFDLIVSNPPYIPSARIPELAPEISRYEPSAALDGGPDGLAVIRRIVASAPSFLNPDGRLMMEIGHDQAGAVSRLAAETGDFSDVLFVRDYAGYERIAIICL